MTVLNQYPASIYSNGQWIFGHIHEDAGRITSVVGTPISEAPQAPYLLPGFVDLHVHGGNGADVMNGVADIKQMAQFHAGFGTVAFCATTVTAPNDDIVRALYGVAELTDRPGDDEATVLGAHLEGPFINPERLGGQPPFAILPDLKLTKKWLNIAPIRIVTLAPELEGAEKVTRFLSEQSVRVQVGHSLADAATVQAAAQWGVTGFAHLFNAVRAISSREPGTAGWALANAEWSELICDLKHVHPDLMKLAIRTIPKPYNVSDCCSAGGRPDGEYSLGTNRVTKRDGLVCISGTKQLAASLLVGIEAFQNIISLGFPIETAIEMTSARPAAYIGSKEYGVIAPGYVASVIQVDESFSLKEVWLRGRRTT